MEIHLILSGKLIECMSTALYNSETCLPNLNWWIREGSIDDLISNQLVCSLGVVYAIPSNMFRRICTWISIHSSIYHFFRPTVYAVTGVTATTEVQ